jgi:hypothetical protein
MVPNPIHEGVDTLLTRDQVAEALTDAGFPIRPKTLATKATRGGGPPFRCFGTRPLYRWSEALAWAQSRLGPPRGGAVQSDAKAHQPRHVRRPATHLSPAA